MKKNEFEKSARRIVDLVKDYLSSEAAEEFSAIVWMELIKISFAAQRDIEGYFRHGEGFVCFKDAELIANCIKERFLGEK